MKAVAKNIESGTAGQADLARSVHLIANGKSGKGLGGSIADKVRDVCKELGFLLEVHEIGSPNQLEEKIQEAVKAAVSDGGVVLAAGGDGTIRSVAEKVQGTGARLGVVPCGTFNYFARTHRIPEDCDAAIRVALTGECRPVRLGELNGRTFLINASMGVYAKLIHDRERTTAIYGRNRAVAILASLKTFLGDHPPLEVHMHTGDQMVTQKTPMVFIGNNALQLRNLNMNVAACMKEDRLALVMLKPLSFAEKARVLARGMLRTVENDERLETFCIDSLMIHSHPRHQHVALDGEIFYMNSPFEVKARPEALRMMLPPKVAP